MVASATCTCICDEEILYHAHVQENRMCISMELVTAVLGDHGQRPREDYGMRLILYFQNLLIV